MVRKWLKTEWDEVIPRGGSKVVPSNAKSWFIWGLIDILRVKLFESPEIEWLEYVVSNRHGVCRDYSEPLLDRG